MGVNKGTNILLRKSTIRLATSYIVFSFAYAVLTMVVDNILLILIIIVIILLIILFNKFRDKK